MPDMLVKLYALPEIGPDLAALAAQGVTIVRALAPDKHRIVDWMREVFEPGWAAECDVALSRQPVSCFIAVHEKQPVGFACYDATSKGFFGPTGVVEAMRGRGIGRALLLAALHAMKEEGYAYAVIGGVSDAAPFYAKTVGATVIEGSAPGIYGRMIKYQ